MASPFRFRRYGESGIEVSELFADLGRCIDDVCVIRSMYTDTAAHASGCLQMNTGSVLIGRPCLGSWLSYGLGTLNPNLPSYIVLCEHTPYAGSQVWDSNFLPPVHQGVRIVPGDDPIPDLHSSAPSITLHELEQRMLRDATTGPIMPPNALACAEMAGLVAMGLDPSQAPSLRSAS